MEDEYEALHKNENWVKSQLGRLLAINGYLELNIIQMAAYPSIRQDWLQMDSIKHKVWTFFKHLV